MKKISALILALCMLLCLTACDGGAKPWEGGKGVIRNSFDCTVDYKGTVYNTEVLVSISNRYPLSFLVLDGKGGYLPKSEGNFYEQFFGDEREYTIEITYYSSDGTIDYKNGDMLYVTIDASHPGFDVEKSIEVVGVVENLCRHEKADILIKRKYGTEEYRFTFVTRNLAELVPSLELNKWW